MKQKKENILCKMKPKDDFGKCNHIYLKCVGCGHKEDKADLIYRGYHKARLDFEEKKYPKIRQQTAQEIFKDIDIKLLENLGKEEEACVYFSDIEKIKQKYLGDKE